MNIVDYAAQLFKQIYSDQEVAKGALVVCLSRTGRAANCMIEFDEKRKNAVSTNERLQLEAQAVLDVTENLDVAQAPRQDKNQNLQYLRDNYNVRPFPLSPIPFLTLSALIVEPLTNDHPLQFRKIPILVLELWRRR